jgi:hypothetical protein
MARRPPLSVPVSGRRPPAPPTTDVVVDDGLTVVDDDAVELVGFSVVLLVDEVDDDVGLSVVLLVDEVDDDVGLSVVLLVDEVVLLVDEVDDDVGFSVVLLVDEVVLLVDEVDDDVGFSVVLLVDEVVDELDVVGVVSQPLTQNTLCFTSAPCAPSALMVSLTCHPCWGCGSNPWRGALRSYVFEASSPASDPPPLLSSSPMKTSSVRITTGFPVGGCTSKVTSAKRSPSSKP